MSVKEEGSRGSPRAMAFHSRHGLISAYQYASRFAGAEGRVATLPDIIDARLVTDLDSTAWRSYFTTSSGEYFGLSKGGSPIIIVAHGVGPMSSVTGIHEAYRHEFKDRARSNKGGRIPQQEFWDLENGKFGEVSIVDLNEYLRRYKHPLIQYLRASEALTDPLFAARCGNRAEEFVRCQVQAVQERYRKLLEEYDAKISSEALRRYERGRQPDADMYIIRLESANCYYPLAIPDLDGSSAFAHLLCIDPLVEFSQDSKKNLGFDIDLFEWWHGTRLVGVAGKGQVAEIHPGAADDLYSLMLDNWHRLMLPAGPVSGHGFFALMEFGEELFTQHQKQGESMDTGEPEFRVRSKQKVAGGPAVFETKNSCRVSFKYGVREVQQIAPQGANAYLLVGNPSYENGFHYSRIEFYSVEIDSSKRLPRIGDLERDYDTVLALVQGQSGE